MWMLRLALMNLLRNKKRVALSLVSVVAGVAVYIMGTGFNSGLGENILRAQIDKVSGHVLLRPAGYATDALSPDLDGFFEVDADAATWLDEHSVAWTRRVTFAPDAIAGPDLVRLRGIVFEPDRDEAVFPRTEWKVEGVVPDDDGVLIGAGVASLLDVGVGDWLTLRTRTVGGAINALQVPIQGVVRTGSPMIDGRSVLVPWELGHELLRQGESTSHVNVRLSDRDAADAFAADAVSKLAADVESSTWEQETADIMGVQELRQRIIDALTLALLGMAATGIANTILMAAYERIREIGTLRAMGMTRNRVLGLFLIEGALLGLVGSALGVLLGGAVVWQGSVSGIDMTAMMEGQEEAMQSIPVSLMLYMDFDPGVLALAFVFGVALAVLSSVYPALAATKTSPADAVRA